MREPRLPVPTGVPVSGLKRALSGLCLSLSMFGFVPAADALTIHYDATRDARLKRCDALAARGQGTPAERCYERLFGDAGPFVAAQAARELGRVRDANRLFREAAADSRDPAIRTAWAWVYLDTHQVSDATALFREALLSDERYIPARIGLAAALSESFEGQAREALAALVMEEPESVHALVLLARIELELQNLARARSLLNRALTHAEQQGIPPLEIYALHAGANLLDDEPITPWTRRALAFNPSYGAVYSIPAHFYIITYRYREAVALYQQAVDIDPTLASAHRDLGINLLRINNVFGARHHLGRAFELDPFDARTVNTLRLIDSLDDMRVSAIDVPDPADPERTLGRVLIRLDREQADALQPHVVDLAIDAVQTFTRRYRFRLQKPMVVELYHDHDDFAVRTVSTPGIGLLGVTFGYVTAMDSPKARRPGEFHWGSTLWHEIAHVFTLEATNHRLPRWLSEGLSVYEEWNTGPLAERELSLDVLEAIRDERLLPIASLDAGFVRPTYPGQVQVSYMQAGLIADYIASRFGHESLVDLLYAFADGATTEAALQDALGIEAARFDVEFRDMLDTRYGEFLAGLDDYRVAVRQLDRAVEAEDWISTEALARDLIRRYPERVGAGSPYLPLAEAQRQSGADAEATATLLVWYRRGGHEPEMLQRLIGDLRAGGRDDTAAEVMESLNWVMPYVGEQREWLGEHYLASGDTERAAREFDALLGLRPDDTAAAWFGHARVAIAEGRPVEARRQLLYALEAAPFYRPAQRLLLELATGDPVD